MNPAFLKTAGTVALWALVAAVGPAHAQHALPDVRVASAIQRLASSGNGNQTTITNLIASPGTISFSGIAPGMQAPGSSNATVSFTINSNNKGGTWTLSVGATSNTFPGCLTVPVRAVTLRCSAASAVGGNAKGATAACAASNFTPLATSIPGSTVASGSEPQSQSADYSVTLSYQLADSWQYIPNICPLNITYTVNAP